MKTVSIHQPNYLPWLGFFYKIYAADAFIFLDDAQHSKAYPTRRTLLRLAPNADLATWLTVPLLRHSNFSPIHELEIDFRQPWQELHLQKMKNAYSTAPFFQHVFPVVESWLAASIGFARLADFNIFLVKSVLGLLAISTPLHRSSELPGTGSSRTERLVELVTLMSGDAYLSGKGGQGYQDEAAFSKNRIQLIYSEFGGWLAENPYPQAQGGSFLGGLSVLDGLFNIGVEGIREMLDTFENKQGNT